MSSSTSTTTGTARATAGYEDTHLHAFLEEIFSPLHRAEQRRWARAYLRGLLHVSGRKTLRSMARTERLPPAAAHSLHQFINTSTWDWEPVRRRLALRVAAGAAPYAWTATELLIPKRGEHSVGVHRRVDTETGRTVNCQRAVGLFLVTDAHCFPVDWSLVLDGPWGCDQERRLRARIPEEETARSVGACVLDYAAGTAAQPRLPRLPWVLDLTRSEDASGVLAGLARHRADILCEVNPGQVVIGGRRTPTVTTVSVLMDERNARRPYVMTRHASMLGAVPVTAPSPAPASGGASAPAAFPATVPAAVSGPVPLADPRYRGGARAPLYTYAGTVRLPLRTVGADGAQRGYRLLELPDPDGLRPARYWITSLDDRRVERILALMRSRATVRSTVTALQERFGALDFEGRSYPGWHHHMTMTSAAYAYQHLRRRGSTAAPPSRSPTPVPARAAG
ncbi:transposase [Streptomyces sp. NPDC048659]|uniref:IS701 family transposase n=1 Tax=Streptomyces sp. NPDC048659 TaxID=3155489 RepID=UPI00341B3286